MFAVIKSPVYQAWRAVVTVLKRLLERLKNATWFVHIVIERELLGVVNTNRLENINGSYRSRGANRFEPGGDRKVGCSIHLVSAKEDKPTQAVGIDC